jgi:hypothetical protein
VREVSLVGWAERVSLLGDVAEVAWVGCGDDGGIDAVAGIVGSGPAIDHVAVVPFDTAEVMGVEPVAGSFLEDGQGDVRLTAPSTDEVDLAQRQRRLSSP